MMLRLRTLSEPGQTREAFCDDTIAAYSGMTIRALRGVSEGMAARSKLVEEYARRRDDSRHRLALSWHPMVSVLAAIVTIVLQARSVHAGPLHESSAMPAAATEGISAAGITDHANPDPCDTTGLEPPLERCMPGTQARIYYGPERLLTIGDPDGRSAGETLPIHPVGESSEVLPERHRGSAEADHDRPR